MSAPSPSTPSSRLRTLLLALGILILAFFLIAGGTFALLRHSINAQIQHLSIDAGSSDSMQSSSTGSTPTVQGTLNFLILGSDSRSSGGDPHKWHPGTQRSDVMMLLQLSADRTRLSVMSLPRDLWVTIPHHGEGRINAAYSLGGPELAISTVEELIGSPIHHFAIVDFESFAQLTDELGGVTINTPAGPQHLDGRQALAFVRERYSLPAGDLDRVRRQQAWIQAIFSTAFEQETLHDPLALRTLLQTLLSHSAVDEGLTFDSLAALAFESRNLEHSNIVFFTAPVERTPTTSDSRSVLILNEEAMVKLRKAWANDQVQEYVSASPDVRVLGTDPVH